MIEHCLIVAPAGKPTSERTVLTFSHRLAPLLTPRSIAVIGASARPDSYGNGMIRSCTGSGFSGRVYLVNPNYDAIEGRPCHPSIGALPEAVDHAVIGVANDRLEAILAEAIAAGARAATIFASCYLDESRRPPLAERLAGLAREAALPVCGGNSSGFYNLDGKVRIGMGGDGERTAGGVAMISQSGSVYGAMHAIGGRIDWNLLVSSGQEFTTTAADYLDFALDLGTTRAVGLFIETARQPERFVAALEKAAARDIPVVVVKVGRSEASARFAATHSGAVVGSDASYDAVFDRHGVLRVADLDEMVATLQLMSMPRRAGPGGLAAIHDSGGERELLVDHAVDIGVPFARLGEATEARLAARLEYGLAPENPLDAWGTGNDFAGIFHDCFAALMDDADTAAGLWVADIHRDYSYHEAYCDAAIAVARQTDKPLAVATCSSVTENRDAAVRLLAAGVPLIAGTRPSLTAVRRMFDYRDFRARRPAAPPDPPPPETVARWRARLGEGAALDEAEGLALLGDFGVPVAPARIVETADGAAAAAAALGFPVALKTAAPGVTHKSEVGGVRLGLCDGAAVRAAHGDLAGRLGPRCLVSPMAPTGVELALGVVIDAQFGPLVMVGAGGVLVEHYRDNACALAPCDGECARRLVDRLAIRPLLDGARGAPAADLASLCVAIARLSVLAGALGDRLAGLDANPVIAGADGCVAVDALVVPVNS